MVISGPGILINPPYGEMLVDMRALATVRNADLELKVDSLGTGLNQGLSKFAREGRTQSRTLDTVGPQQWMVTTVVKCGSNGNVLDHLAFT